MRRTKIYVDEFNLYYGLVKDTPYRWLDIKILCQKVLPKDCNILSINYYTAIVKRAPDKADRQNAYLKALRLSTPELRIIFGRYQIVDTWMPEAIAVGKDRYGKNIYAEGKNKLHVIKREEKKTDVNLAVDIVTDAWKDQYDLAVLISNDNDIASALNEAKKLGKEIGLANATRRSRNSSRSGPS